MSITAQSIIQRCVDALQDPTSIRWPVAELVRYLNDGQREVVLHRPDAMRKSAAVALVAGTRQTIPSDGLKLIDIVRNTRGTKRAVRQVNREILDAQTPGWHGLTGSTEILHFMFDARDPTAFYVYPPASSSGASVEALYASAPADVSEPPPGSLYTAVTGNISVPDIYGNALQDYILARGYTKDSEYAGNAQRAQSHLALFATALGIELKATLSVAPTTQDNPNMAAARG